MYSGVRGGADATTTFHIALGRLRSNQVFLVGYVSLPGAYQVSSVATVFNALYRAGGPAEQGSMRSIEVRRGGRLAGEVDLYDYLIRGDGSDDIRSPTPWVCPLAFSGKMPYTFVYGTTFGGASCVRPQRSS